ncbi:MAG: hypothetical protein IT538_13260 [Variibacter sp.]|nr:hypothetical protein [Variibacter sp.]
MPALLPRRVHGAANAAATKQVISALGKVATNSGQSARDHFTSPLVIVIAVPEHFIRARDEGRSREWREYLALIADSTQTKVIGIRFAIMADKRSDQDEGRSLILELPELIADVCVPQRKCHGSPRFPVVYASVVGNVGNAVNQVLFEHLLVTPYVVMARRVCLLPRNSDAIRDVVTRDELANCGDKLHLVFDPFYRVVERQCVPRAADVLRKVRFGVASLLLVRQIVRI